MLLTVVFAVFVAGQDCAQSYERFSELLASPEPAEQITARRLIHTCGTHDPARWFPRLCSALKNAVGTPELRSELVGELFLNGVAKHHCEKSALAAAAVHEPVPDVKVRAASLFKERYPTEAQILVAPLTKLLEQLEPDEPDNAVNGALRLLAEIGSDGRGVEEAVLPYLEARSSGTPLLACRTLSAIGASSSKTLESLRRMVESEPFYDTLQCANGEIERITGHNE